MIKRSNQIVALALAAASVMATVPAMAADSVRLSNKDGHIYSGVSFKDGKYGYYGYRANDDETKIYYNSGSKDKDTSIKDTDDYEIDTNTFMEMMQRVTTSEGVKYGNKYIIATEGGNSDEYLIDLTTGKVADIDAPEDQQNSAKGRLITGLKKAERYNSISDLGYKIENDDIAIQRLFKGKFGDVWYQYSTSPSAVKVDENGNLDYNGAEVLSAADSFGDTTTGASIFTGFTDQNGKYIDASYKANLKVYNERKQKASVIEKFGKIYKDEGLKLNLKSLKALAQDKDYIYALAKVDVEYYTPLTDGGRVAGANDRIVGYKFDEVRDTRTQYFVQKISKARSEADEDGAYIPKSVDAWQLDYNDDGKTLNGLDPTYEEDGDRADAAKAIIDNALNYSVINGTLYVTTLDGQKVKVWKMKFKNDKLHLANSTLTNNLRGSAANEDDSVRVDAAVITKDDDAKSEYDDWTVDTDGNTWVLVDGQIKMFDGSDFKTKYRCDRGFDRLDVYDSGDLIAWDSDHDDDDDKGAYTTVQEGKQQTVTEGQIVDPNLIDKTGLKIGWDQAADGTWNFYDATGTKIVNNWANPGGVWYYLDENGNMVSGWREVNGNWYYFNPYSDGTKGSMRTGWQLIDGIWYYLNSSGAMETGWQLINGKWYYFNPISDGTRGFMKTGWIYDGAWYYLYSDGAMASDTTIDGYYVSSSGALV